MIRRMMAVSLVLAASVSACSPIRDYHGYIADEALPREIEPGVDTRSTVLARLGSPSTKSIFDDNTWIYMSATRTRIAYFKPKVTERTVTAIRFGEDNMVAEVLNYDRDDGEIIRYASAQTPTRGRQLGLLEQIFGTLGVARLPAEVDPNSPTGRR